MNGISMQRLVGAEILRAWSVRSCRVLVLGGLAAVLLIGAVLAYDTRGAAGGPDPQAVALPLEYGAYLTMILGIILVTADLGSGTAVVAACQVPVRRRLLVGKYVAALTSAVVLTAVMALLLAVTVVVVGRTGVGELWSVDFRDLWLAGLGAALVGAVLGVALGQILQVTALALTLTLLWSFVIETVLVFVIPERIAAYLPFKTIGGSRILLDELGPFSGLALFAAVAGIAALIAVVLHPRRDLFVP